MVTRYIGEPVPRNEDKRLLRGKALFVDDGELPGMLHATFLRATYAHARIASIDASAAKRRAGVVAVYTADDLGEYWAPGPLLVEPPPIENIVFNARTQVPLAKDKVRHAMSRMWRTSFTPNNRRVQSGGCWLCQTTPP